MALLNVPSTKSSLLVLRRQLEFAQEGYDLLDRKRELLLRELGATAGRAALARESVESLLARANAALREAQLDAGSAAVDRAALGVLPVQTVKIKEKRFMGTRLPLGSARAVKAGFYFGPGGTPAAADGAVFSFNAALPGLAELAGLDTAAARLAHELKRTQRRCNTLSKKVIPDRRETIAFLGGTLEERERDSFVILKMIRNRLRAEG